MRQLKSVTAIPSRAATAEWNITDRTACSRSCVETFVAWWTGLNYVRMTIGGIGWLCALRALSFTGAENRTVEPAKEHA